MTTDNVDRRDKIEKIITCEKIPIPAVEDNIPEVEIPDFRNIEFENIIDIHSIQYLLQDFFELIPIPLGIIDLNGKILVKVGWQDICTKFHRVNPQTRKFCIESDIQLSSTMTEGSFSLYKCKNNLFDAATPIYIAGKKVANLFTGQFFLEEKKLDYDLFRKRAKKYHFDEKKYLAALDKVPRLSKLKVKKAMEFLQKIAKILSLSSYSNKKLEYLLAENKRAQLAIETSTQESMFLAQIVKSSSQPFAISFPDGSIGLCNKAFEDLVGYSVEELKTLNWKEVLTPDKWAKRELSKLDELHRTGNLVRYEKEFIKKDGSVIPVELLVHFSKDPQNNSIYYHTFITDITQRKKDHQALQKNLEELKQFNCLMVDRESEIIDLKKEINNFCKQLRQPLRYDDVDSID